MKEISKFENTKCKYLNKPVRFELIYRVIKVKGVDTNFYNRLICSLEKECKKRDCSCQLRRYLLASNTNE